MHYRGEWLKPIEGLATGGSESGSIANIYVKWVLDRKILVHPEIKKLNKMDKRKRFFDDIWSLWRGTIRNFDKFLKTFNQVGCEYGITLKGEVSDIVNFLDVTTMLVNGEIRTCLYTKPTDAKRYLHRKSDHSLHTFKSTPYSQFRRAILLCSEKCDQLHFIGYMFQKFLDSGYSRDELNSAKEKALLQVDRVAILNEANSNLPVSKEKENTLTFVINHDKVGSSQIRNVVKENKEMIDYLFGKEMKIVVAERRSPNTASLLFAKSSFAKDLVEEKDIQECGVSRCMTCEDMGLKKSEMINGHLIKLDFRLNCGSENVIYLYICKHCPKNKEFYFGQTDMCLRRRANGHRSCFTEDKYMKSALSFHVWDKHREHLQGKLGNFRVGVVKSTSPEMLDRAEDYFVTLTNANVVGLNRYKAMM